MDSLENITTVSDLLNAQVEEEVVSESETKERDADFDRGQELLDQIRELRPDIWLKLARRLVLDTADLHRDITVKLNENGKSDKAMNWAYDTGVLEAAFEMLNKVNL